VRWSETGNCGSDGRRGSMWCALGAGKANLGRHVSAVLSDVPTSTVALLARAHLPDATSVPASFQAACRRRLAHEFFHDGCADDPAGPIRQSTPRPAHEFTSHLSTQQVLRHDSASRNAVAPPRAHAVRPDEAGGLTECSSVAWRPRSRDRKVTANAFMARLSAIIAPPRYLRWRESRLRSDCDVNDGGDDRSL